MSHWSIWHNPKCSKSRQSLELLRNNGIEPEVFEYLKTPPTSQQIEKASQNLNLPLADFTRKKEAIYKELNPKDEAELLAAMVENPILIERPIVQYKNKAVLGRPPENIETLIKMQNEENA